MEGRSVDPHRHCASLSALLFLTFEGEPNILELLHLGAETIPKLEWAVQPFLAENHCLRLGCANSPHENTAVLSMLILFIRSLKKMPSCVSSK